LPSNFFHCGREQPVRAHHISDVLSIRMAILGRLRHSRSRVVPSQNDHSFCGAGAVHVNAMSTRIRRFGAVGEGENTSMSVGVELENLQNQRLGA
jgi:hypothetical protein